MKDLFVMFAIKLSKRKSIRQKKYFSNIISQLLSKIGYAVTVQRARHGLMNTVNIIIGNVKTARRIMVCGYDDHEKVYLPHYRYYPLDAKAGRHMDLLNIVIKSIILLLIACITVLVWLAAQQFAQYQLILRIAALALTLLFVMTALGIRNKSNFSKDGALAILMNCAINNRHNEINDICYVMCDNMIALPIGLNDFIIEYPEAKNKEIVYLDRCGSGDTVAIAYSKDLTAFGQKLGAGISDIKVYSKQAGSSDSNYFSINDKFCYIGTGTSENDSFFVEGADSAHDSSVNFEILEKLSAAVEQSING